MAAFWRPWYNGGMNTDLPVPTQFAHMAKAACLVLLHPTENLIAVASRRGSTVDGLPGGKMDPGETMAQTAVRETGEEVGVWVKDVDSLELLFADAIPGERDFWVESFVAVSHTAELKQMEPGITVKWTTWDAFLQNNAFKEYNIGVHNAFLAWAHCRQNNVPFVPDHSHLVASPSPGF